METARYHHALEIELARTIATVQSVQNARVHLAMSRQSALLRNRSTASASVLVNLFPGRRLESQQVAAITHLVASSVPDLEAARVTVIDQTGRLLSFPSDSDELGRSGAQFEYVNRMEETYARRIVGLLEPLVGPGKVRAEVNAAVDFTEAEEVSEAFGTERSALRSEQTAEDIKRGGMEAQGIPGALTDPAARGCPADAAGRARPSGSTACSRGRPGAGSCGTDQHFTTGNAQLRDRSHVEPQAARARQPAQAVGGGAR